MKKSTLVAAAFVAMTFAAGTVKAADPVAAPAAAAEQKMETVSGVVVKVDAAAGSIVIKTKKKEELTLQAEAKLLEGIKDGQHVTIEKTGNVVQSIKEKAGKKGKGKK